MQKMSHDQDHTHGGSGNMLLFAVLLTLGYAAVEAGVGLWAGSLALVAVTVWLEKRSPSLRHSFGLGRAEFIAAPVNSLELLHENVRKYGTVFNTIAPGTQLSSELHRKHLP
jgi:cobalt-zinc-cadmium efflux system protein